MKEFIVVFVVIIIVYLILKYIFSVDIKKIKQIGDNSELDEIINKYPSNIEICEEILEKLKNKDTVIEENKEVNTTMFLITSDKILIANLKDNFTRIQTIAHECLHSVQDKKILWFNFLYSNFYLIFFVIISILTVLNLNENKEMYLNFLILFGFIYYVVRIYLENDAMIKARFLAKEYMQEKKISSENEIEKIIFEYDKLNDIGIKCVNFNMFESVAIRCLIYIIICII